MANNDALVQKLYEGFNRRDIPAVLRLLAENVDWANGMDGGHVHGREAVRAYWTKQWAAIAPQVDPMQRHPAGRRSDRGRGPPGGARPRGQSASR